MRYLFLVLTLLGLVSYGDTVRTRPAGSSPHSRRSMTAQPSSAVDVVIISDDGTPFPKKR